MPITSLSTIAMSTWSLAGTFAVLADLRTDVVSLSARQLDRHGWAAAERSLRDSGLAVGAVGCGLTTPVDSTDDARRAAGLDLVERSVDLAARLDVPLVTLTTGPAGFLTWEDAIDEFARQVAPLTRKAADLGVHLTLENTHSVRSDVSFVHTLRDAVAAARHVGVGVCADLYCCWAEPALAQTFADALDVIRIVQYADFVHGTLAQPNRWVPGDGDLPMDRLVETVLAAGYTGVHEIEILGPRVEEEGVAPSHARALAWLEDRLGRAG